MPLMPTSGSSVAVARTYTSLGYQKEQQKEQSNKKPPPGVRALTRASSHYYNRQKQQLTEAVQQLDAEMCSCTWVCHGYAPRSLWKVRPSALLLHLYCREKMVS